MQLSEWNFLRNLLARREIHVANYYFERGAYLAAVNRGALCRRETISKHLQSPMH